MNFVLHIYKKEMVAKTFLDVDYTSEFKKNQIWRLDNDKYIMDYIFNTIYYMGN